MFVPGEPRASQALATALIACEQLLEEALEGAVPPHEWAIEDLESLRDRLEERLMAEARRTPP
jgi:hypothetical protein